MGHYRCVQVSLKPIAPQAIADYSINIDMLGDHPGADYHGQNDMRDALEVLQDTFGEAIISHTDKYVVVSKARLGKILTEKYNKWRSEVSLMSFEEAMNQSYKTMRAEQFFSTGNLFHDDEVYGYPVCSWEFLTYFYLWTMKNRHRVRLYYGASIDFHS